MRRGESAGPNRNIGSGKKSFVESLGSPRKNPIYRTVSGVSTFNDTKRKVVATYMIIFPDK